MEGYCSCDIEILRQPESNNVNERAVSEVDAGIFVGEVSLSRPGSVLVGPVQVRDDLCPEPRARLLVREAELKSLQLVVAW